jgi:hypothetical protein
VDWLKTVFHIHTNHSDDSNATAESLIDSARVAGVDCIVATDHDTLGGARALQAVAPSWLRVVIGEEISTADGHLIGLFMSENIKPNLPVRVTAERIREQGGLVAVPHPFNIAFGCSLRQKVHDIIDLIDIVEVANAQNLMPWPNLWAARFARQHGLPGIVGADMHHRDYLCPCFQWLPPFDGPNSFVQSLHQATLVRGRQPLTYFLRTARIIIGSRTSWGVPKDYGVNCTHVRGKPVTNPVLSTSD